MSEDKRRKRSSNWLRSEKELLISLVELHYNVVEIKRTDGDTMKKKIKQWKIIANQYNNSRTNHCSRTGENLKAQWESMKKAARKDAANHRKLKIQTGGGSPIPSTKEDPILQRILSLISTTAAGIYNPQDSNSTVPAVEEQTAIQTTVKTEDFPESPIQDEDIPVPTLITVEDQTSNMSDTQELGEKDLGDYLPQLLGTPASLALKIDHNEKTPTNEKRTGSSKRPTHTSTHSSLEQLHRKKIEAIELQKRLAVKKMDRSKVSHDLDIQIKKELLKQEKIKTSMLLIKRRKLAKAFKKRKTRE